MYRPSFNYRKKISSGLSITLCLVWIFLQACAMTEKLQPEAVYRSHSGLDGALSHSAETRSVHIMNRKDKYKFCAEPAPDVGVAKEGGLSIGFNFLYTPLITFWEADDYFLVEIYHLLKKIIMTEFPRNCGEFLSFSRQVRHWWGYQKF